MLWSSISTLLLHIPLCWLMVFKTSLGYTGAALAISISYWLNVFMLATYIRFSKSCKETRSPPTIEAFRGVGLFLRLALPSALMLWSFTFARLYSSVDADIAQCVEKAESAKQEKNRAAVVALNAEIRRTKAKLLEEDLPKLQRLALKEVKGLTKEELSARKDLVAALPDRIQSIPDGSTTATKKNGTWGASGSRTGGTIKFDSTSDGNFDDEYFKGTEESNQFRQEYEMRKMKQDEGLDTIGEGLATLKNMASDMNEELDRQVPLIDEMEDKVDRANADLKNTNVRLKETFLQLRSSCNFCI